MPSPTTKRLFLIDGHALVYRAHFAFIRAPLITSDGRHTSALYGFCNSILRILREDQPDYLALVFDTAEKTFRHLAYPDYKATRERMPDELRGQLPDLARLVEAWNIPRFELPGFEADDIIGTLSRQAAAEAIDAYIVSGDKDFAQLVGERVRLAVPGKGGEAPAVMGREEVVQKWGVAPEQIVDLLALMGDSSDNVPGIRGVGPKTAAQLLNEFGSLDNLYAHLSEVKNPRLREKLETGKGNAELSRSLVTIRTDLNMGVSMPQLARRDPAFDQLAKLFREFEFFRLVDGLQEIGGKVEKTRPATEKKYQTITSLEELREAAERLKAAPLVSMDLETTSLDPLSAEIVGFSFSIAANEGIYIPLKFAGKAENLFGGDDLAICLEALRPVWENPALPKCGQNIKFDMEVLRSHGVTVDGVVMDTMIAAHLLRPDARTYKLDRLSEEFLSYAMVPITDLIGTGKEQITMDQVPLDEISFYAAEDADVAFQLAGKFGEMLRQDDLVEFMGRVEMPLLPVLVEMESAGVFVDGALMAEMSRWMEAKLRQFSADICKEAGLEFNLNSPQQLAAVLFDQLGLPKIRKRSTDVEVLEALGEMHPLPGKVVEYRKFQKLKSTYVDAIPVYIHKQTGRVHSSFSQTSAATGRLASSEPNFQNIPIRSEEGREIRKAFRAQQKGWVILSCDYSQIELRVMAHLSGDEELRASFLRGEDVHARTAGEIFGVGLAAVQPEMRRVAKVVNFAVMYGAGPFRLSQELGIPMEEGRKIIEAYFGRFPRIREFVDRTLAEAREKKYVRTLLGRRRPCPDLEEQHRQMRAAAERATVNMPIQGTAAELIKLAMIDIHKDLRRRGSQAKMILQIHDELLFEVPREELDEVRGLVVERMENALKLEVPLVVDSGVGDSWFEAH